MVLDDSSSFSAPAAVKVRMDIAYLCGTAKHKAYNLYT